MFLTHNPTFTGDKMQPLYPVNLLILLAICQRIVTLPVKTKEPMPDICTVYSRALFYDISDALKNITLQKMLFTGMNITQQRVEINKNTDTPFACAPHGTRCFNESESQFNQDSCKSNIEKDLHYYYKFLKAQPDPDKILEKKILLRLENLIKNCFPRALPAPEELNQSSAESLDEFDSRVKLCQTLKGFQIRTITINRALGYMQSEGRNE